MAQRKSIPCMIVNDITEIRLAVPLGVIDHVPVPWSERKCMGKSTRHTLTVIEAARLLGISRNSAYEAVRQGEIPSVRIGRRIIVPLHALDQLLGRDHAAILDVLGSRRSGDMSHDYPRSIPSMIPADKVLVHNTVPPARRQGTRGF